MPEKWEAPGRGRPAASLHICSSQAGSWGNSAVPCSLELSTSRDNELSDIYLVNSAYYHTRNKMERSQERSWAEPRRPCPVISIVYFTRTSCLWAGALHVDIFSVSVFTFFGFRIVILTIHSLPLGDKKEEGILFVSFRGLLGVRRDRNKGRP